MTSAVVGPTTISLLMATGLVPHRGVAVVAGDGNRAGGTMTAVSVAARHAPSSLSLRAGEVAAALSLGLTERDSRILGVRQTAAEALIELDARGVLSRGH